MSNDDGHMFVLPQSFYIHYDHIDEEHEALISVINECSARLVDGVLEEFEDMFEKFRGLLADHFENEEAHMRDLGYHGLEWHREHHRECLDRLDKVVETMRGQGYAGLRELRVCFHDIIHDIARADLKFGEFVEGLGLVDRKT